MTIYANLICKLFVFGFNLLSNLCCDWTGWLVSDSVCLVRLGNNGLRKRLGKNEVALAAD